MMVRASVKGEAYEPLNRQWKSVCKLLLGTEVGELSDYAKWLYDGNGPRLTKKSAISGKDVVYAYSAYSKNSHFASFDEVDLDQKYPPLSLNDVKDIDSLIEAIAERAIYCGNMVLGNSQFVEGSTTITDSYYVLHSERVAFSKYVAYSTRGSYSESIFGCHYFGPAKFQVKCQNPWDCNRCLCVSKTDFSSDCYYSHGLSGCYDCIFCYNLKNKRNYIGNLSLPKDRYASLKQKLVSEMAQELQSKKSLPTLAALVYMAKPDFSALRAACSEMPAYPGKNDDKSKIEKAFTSTSGVIGLQPAAMDACAHWLSANSSVRLDDAVSCATGKGILVPDVAGFLMFPRDRLLSLEEAEFLGEHLFLSASELDALSFTNAPQTLSKIAFFSPYWQAGNLQNNIRCPISIDSSDCYSGIQNMISKKCGFCLLPRNSESCFGCREIRETSFSFNCHFSTRLSRCFEMDNCNNCTGSFFCHNCENVHDSMFCFNTKNKKYAIGNVEVGPEKFRAAKKILLDWINSQLRKNSTLKLDIYKIADMK
jgi:hypothetical protein